MLDPEFHGIAEDLLREIDAMGKTEDEEAKPDRLYTPYQFRFQIGERLELKAGDEFRHAQEAIAKELSTTNVPPNISWIPTEEMLRVLADVPLTVVMTMAYHGGYPLYILQFAHKGQNGEVRLCEAFLKSEGNSRGAEPK